MHSLKAKVMNKPCLNKLKEMVKFFISFLILWGIILGYPVPKSYARKIPYSLNFYTLYGKRVSFSGFKGNYFLLNFFASYCPSCLGEMGVLDSINRECGKELKIVSLLINSDGLPFVLPIIQKNHFSYLIGLANEKILSFFSDFSVTPTTYLISPEGKIVFKAEGFKSFEEWKAILQKFSLCDLRKVK